MSKQNKEVTRLTEVRERTMAEIERLREALQAEIEPVSATDDDAAADVASDIYERSKIISLIQSLESKLRSLDNALAAAERGTYGICEMCGAEIPAERLEVVPETTLCVRCASKMEQNIRRWQTTLDEKRLGRRRTTDYEAEEEEEEEESDDYDNVPDYDEDL